MLGAAGVNDGDAGQKSCTLVVECLQMENVLSCLSSFDLLVNIRKFSIGKSTFYGGSPPQ